MEHFRKVIKNLLIIAVVFGFYLIVRSFSANNFGDAFSNARSVLSFQRSLGVPSEYTVQKMFVDNLNVARIFNTYYMYAHFVGTLSFLVVSYLWNQTVFCRIRDLLIGVTVVGGIVHLAYPLAPPRMLGGFIDFGKVVGPDPYQTGVSEFANQIAAMPSLHVAWAVIVSYGIYLLLGKWGVAGYLHAVFTALVVVVTGNHYWMDVAVALLIFAVVFRSYGKWKQSETSSDLLTRTENDGKIVSCKA